MHSHFLNHEHFKVAFTFFSMTCTSIFPSGSCLIFWSLVSFLLSLSWLTSFSFWWKSDKWWVNCNLSDISPLNFGRVTCIWWVILAVLPPLFFKRSDQTLVCEWREWTGERLICCKMNQSASSGMICDLTNHNTLWPNKENTDLESDQCKQILVLWGQHGNSNQRRFLVHVNITRLNFSPISTLHCWSCDLTCSHK